VPEDKQFSDLSLLKDQTATWKKLSAFPNQLIEVEANCNSEDSPMDVCPERCEREPT
jgi:hypothetical protein